MTDDEMFEKITELFEEFTATTIENLKTQPRDKLDQLKRDVSDPVRFEKIRKAMLRELGDLRYDASQPLHKI